MLFSTEPYIKKKFFYRNMLQDSSKVDFLNQYKVLQQMKEQHSSNQHIHTQTSQIGLYKPMFTIHSPQTSQTNNKSERPGFSSIRRFHTHNSQQTLFSKGTLDTPVKESRKERRAPLHKRKINCSQPALEITDYLNFLKSQKSNVSIKYSDLLKEEPIIPTISQQKQQNYKKQKEETRNHLLLLYQCTHTIQSIREGANLQELVNMSTHSYPNIKQTIEQLMQDIELAAKIYTNDTQLGSVLGKITGVDYKIFYMFFRPLYEYPESCQQFNTDEGLHKNYRFIKPNKYDVYYRVFGAGDLPLQFQDQLGESHPLIKGQKFRQSEIQSSQSNTEIPSVDFDFLKRITYYQKNLQLFLKQKQNEILGILKEQLVEEETKNGNLLRKTILLKLSDSENQIGHFPLVSRQHRFQFEKTEYDQRILNKLKS